MTDGVQGWMSHCVCVCGCMEETNTVCWWGGRGVWNKKGVCVLDWEVDSMWHGSGGYAGGGRALMKSMGSLVRGESSARVPNALWAFAYLSHLCAFAHSHFITLSLLAFMHLRAHMCAYCLSHCHGHMSTFTWVHLRMCVCVRHSFRGYSNRGTRVVCPGQPFAHYHY